MTTIPKEERAAATEALNEVKGWLGQADYQELAKELKEYQASTIRSVAKSERFNLDIYTKLLQLGRAKKAAFLSQLNATAKTGSSRDVSAIVANKPVKTPENAPVADAIEFPAQPLPKSKPKRKPAAATAAPDSPPAAPTVDAVAAADGTPAAPTKRRRPAPTEPANA